MNKSGIQAQLADAAFKTMVEATVPYCLKILHGARDLPLVNAWANRRRGLGGGLLILRYVTPDTVQIGDLPGLTGEALRLFAGWEAFATGGITVVLELPINEKFHSDLAEFARLAEASVPQAQRVKDAGFTPGVLITSEGNPPGDDDGAPFFLQPRVLECMRAFRRMGAIWCPHGYSHPPAPADDPDHFDRPRRILARLPEDARLNYAFGEFGCDGGCELPDKKPGVGWMGYFGPIGDYAAWVHAQVRAMATDPLCVGGAVFLSGHDPSGQPNFSTFDVRDEVDFRPVLIEDVPGPAIIWLGPLPTPPEEQPVTTPGIDVSNHQGVIDWPRVAASGVRFAGMKASGDEGIGNVYVDPTFPDNWHQSRANGLVRIAYHYARPSVVSPAASVTTFQRAIQAVGGLHVGDLVALDMEDPDVPDGVSLHVWVAEWLALAEDVFGVRPAKYSARYYTSTHDLEHDDLERFPTWWAAYQASIPPSATGWDIDIWQNSASGTCPGVTGQVDTNLFLGTVEELRLLGLPAPAVVDWETPVFGPIYRGASAVGGMPDKTPDDEQTAQEIIRLMDVLKAAHG